MCIGETKHSPSLTPLLRTISSTWSVMCTISLRFLVSKTRYSVWLFITVTSPQRLDAEILKLRNSYPTIANGQRVPSPQETVPERSHTSVPEHPAELAASLFRGVEFSPKGHLQGRTDSATRQPLPTREPATAAGRAHSSPMFPTPGSRSRPTQAVYGPTPIAKPRSLHVSFR